MKYRKRLYKYASPGYTISQTILLLQNCFSANLPSGEVLHDLNTLHTSTMQMKVDRRFKDEVQKSTNRLFEIIELNVDEPIISVSYTHLTLPTICSV